ncbi:MAG TPA: serine/threonine-protein kinase [Labilithrix sp.]|nr:serine/threonine-protein kinase [Labilithrix sp.]
MTDESSPSEAAAEPGPGDVLGRYQLLVPIASGGMGKVWAARQCGQQEVDRRLGIKRMVAVKTVLPEFASQPSSEKLFLDEARIASAIQHPNVCGTYEVGEHSGGLFLAMEWIDGASLSNVLRALGSPPRMDLRHAARIVAHACAGLHAAHELSDDEGVRMNVVHRDVSPHNILISAAGHVKVADFGIAKASGQLHQRTETGEFRGKLAYAAPEMVIEAPRVDHRADIYGLGCVLYEATVGTRPFARGEMLQTLRSIVEGHYTAPSKLLTDYPPELEKIIVRALALSPDDRFQSAEEMRLALETWLAETGPFVTEAHLAAVVRETCGAKLDDRRKAIRDAMAKFADGDLRDSSSGRSLASFPGSSISTSGIRSGRPLSPPSEPSNISSVVSSATDGRASGQAPHPWARGAVLLAGPLLASLAGVWLASHFPRSAHSDDRGSKGNSPPVAMATAESAQLRDASTLATEPETAPEPETADAANTTIPSSPSAEPTRSASAKRLPPPPPPPRAHVTTTASAPATAKSVSTPPVTPPNGSDDGLSTRK